MLLVYKIRNKWAVLSNDVDDAWIETFDTKALALAFARRAAVSHNSAVYIKYCNEDGKVL